MSTLIDTRLGNAPRYYFCPQDDGLNVRVPDEILKCVGFIGLNMGQPSPVYKGTGFVVVVPGRAGTKYPYLVTARHVAEAITDSGYVFRVNDSRGGTIIFDDGGCKWWYHPTEKELVDCAVTPFITPMEIRPYLDVLPLPAEMFVTVKIWRERNLGIGDEVVATGLFSHVQQTSQNIPILRHGNVAMIPNETIPFGNAGMLWAVLVESRSIGGLSGSPVFIRETVIQEIRNQRGESRFLHGSGDLFFLGSVIGHYNVEGVRDIIDGGAINTGISGVVPATKILEVLHHPELVEMRKQWDEKYAKKSSEGAVLDFAGEPSATQITPEGAEIPVPTQEQFEDALKKASRKVGQQTPPKNAS